MQCYLVGGAVRDQLLGEPVTERDWVVVGATPEIMLELNYKPVGRDFPVFLHPITHEEYALARVEKKIAPGYHGFTCISDPTVSLEEDLIRRDLSINAMAMDATGNIIDPYGGRADIHAKKLRHVSNAFIEDPVRVLRVARFAARYHHLGFTITPETMHLLKSMVINDELNHLVVERIWKEWHASLSTKNPSQFLSCLQECGALSIVLPELDFLAATRLKNANVRLPILNFVICVLTLNMGTIKALCKRLRIPKEYAKLAQIAVLSIPQIKNLTKLTATERLTLLENSLAFRDPKILQQLLELYRVLYQDNNAILLDNLRILCNTVTAETFIEQGYKGKELGLAIRQQRINLMEQMIHEK